MQEYKCENVCVCVCLFVCLCVHECVREKYMSCVFCFEHIDIDTYHQKKIKKKILSYADDDASFFPFFFLSDC